MDMTLSRRGDYVMRSAIALARAFDGGGVRKIREVVADTEIPATFASQILADLVRAGLAVSRAGRDGGYRLARAPDGITVLEVVEAAEGSLHAERCALGEGPCRWEAVCRLRATWLGATAQVRQLLSATSLAELAARDAAIEAGTYKIPGDAHRAHPVAVVVEDRVEVEAPLAQAEAALERLRRSLGGYAAQACGETAALPARARRAAAPAGEAHLGPARAPRGRSAKVRERDLDFRVLLEDATVHLDATLTLRAVDAERCELKLSGRWREEARRALEQPSALEARARPAVRAFLRRVARAIDAPPPR